MVTQTWRTVVCCTGVSVIHTAMAGISFPTTSHQQILLQELSQRFNRNGKGELGCRVIFQVGCCNGYMALNSGANPHDTAAASMGRIGNADTGQGPSKERVTRINHGHRLLRCGHDQFNGGSKLVECSRCPAAPEKSDSCCSEQRRAPPVPRSAVPRGPAGRKSRRPPTF